MIEWPDVRIGAGTVIGAGEVATGTARGVVAVGSPGRVLHEIDDTERDGPTAQ